MCVIRCTSRDQQVSIEVLPVGKYCWVGRELLRACRDDIYNVLINVMFHAFLLSCYLNLKLGTYCFLLVMIHGNHKFGYCMLRRLQGNTGSHPRFTLKAFKLNFFLHPETFENQLLAACGRLIRKSVSWLSCNFCSFYRPLPRKKKSC